MIRWAWLVLILINYRENLRVGLIKEKADGMMKILASAKRETAVSYQLSFIFEGEPGAGFGFDCDSAGTPILTNEAARKNYEACLTGVVNGERVINEGIKRFENSYTVAAIGQCDDCSKRVELTSFTNTCSCGAEYNSFGQRLADHSQWGEETGESYADIMNGSDDY